MKENKSQLEVLLANITEELKTVGIHNPQNPSDWIAVPRDLDAEEPDENLAADNVEEWNERAALVADLETRYNNIVRALKKIEDGTYGSCEICGAPIEEKRLAVSPSSRTCIAHMDDERTLTN